MGSSGLRGAAAAGWLAASIPRMDAERDGEEIEGAIRTLLAQIGEDPERPGLVGTPDRVARMYGELTSGYRTDPDALINGACYQVDYDEMVVVRDIEFYSLCEHHVLPFHGHAYIGYIAHEEIIGISKLSRLVRVFARRFTVQERVGVEIADELVRVLEPHGVAVHLNATHLCTQMRGVREGHSRTWTSFWRGNYENDPQLRTEFLQAAAQTNSH